MLIKMKKLIQLPCHKGTVGSITCQVWMMYLHPTPVLTATWNEGVLLDALKLQWLTSWFQLTASPAITGGLVLCLKIMPKIDQWGQTSALECRMTG